MDSFEPRSERPRSAMSMAITAEETELHFPASMVIGTTEPVTNQMLVINPTVVPVDTFHHHQDNFVSLALNPEQLTNQESLITHSADPFRRLHDNTGGLARDIPAINHIGVFVKGDGAEELHGKQHQNEKPDSIPNLYQNGNLDSPIVPLPESGLSLQALVGGGRVKDPDISYSQECTEDVDSTCSYYQCGKHWLRAERIGEGSSGTCYVGIDKITNTRMVVKQISSDSGRDDVDAEVEVMQEIRHENIVQFYGATRGHRHVNIFMELMEGGSLEDRLRNGAFGEEVICHYSRQLVSGVRYLHYKGVVHRDLKCGNLLTDFTGQILKIADFGAAAELADHQKFYCLAGTYPYIAPEVVLAKEGRGYGAKCDVWSMGCVVIEMATTRPPWVLENQHNHRWEILYRIGKSVTPPPIPRFHREDLKDFAIQCLRVDPDDRPTSESFMRHRLMIEH